LVVYRVVALQRCGGENDPRNLELNFLVETTHGLLRASAWLNRSLAPIRMWTRIRQAQDML
jgi:hypothetical protein